jgi:6-phosphogluconolactonase
LLNAQATGGPGATALITDKTGRCLLVANYAGGSVASLPINQDGSLGEMVSFFQHEGSSVNPKRQAGPHAHSANVDPANRFALFCDLGLDKVMVYKLDAASAKLTPSQPPFAATKPGAGPRHLALHPNGKWIYVINELDSTMTAFRWDGQAGTLQEIQTVSTLPPDFKEQNTCAEVDVHPSGKFVYGSNRGHDSVAVFALDESSGRMRLVEHESTQGKNPRFITLDPTGHWLLAANQATDNIALFRVDPATGKLEYTGRQVEVGAPVCVKFMPAP